MTLVRIKVDLWNRGATFDTLACVMINISNLHSVPYIIISMDNYILIDTESTMAEAGSVATPNPKNIFNVSSIYGAMFLTRDGTHAKGSNWTT